MLIFTCLKALISMILVTNITNANIMENPANITRAFLTENEKMLETTKWLATSYIPCRDPT